MLDTIRWDGPPSYEAFVARWGEHVRNAHTNEDHFFVIADALHGPVGCCDVRPDAERFRADMGLWIGMPYQGMGIGTRAVSLLTRYGFEELGLTKVEAHVFVGNWASRRVFEKNGFELEGTIRAAHRKRGRAVDEWYFGKVV